MVALYVLPFSFHFHVCLFANRYFCMFYVNIDILHILGLKVLINCQNSDCFHTGFFIFSIGQTKKDFVLVNCQNNNCFHTGFLLFSIGQKKKRIRSNMVRNNATQIVLNVTYLPPQIIQKTLLLIIMTKFLFNTYCSFLF